MNVQVLAPGLQATVQDAGRHGWRHLGVGRSGALDPYSRAVANLLVGNAAEAPVLEFALAGPRLHFERAARVAIAGATCEARVGDVPIPGWRPVDLPAGSELRLGRCVEGARAYLAVAGGWSVPGILGSASTDLRGGFGGAHGRALVAGDALTSGDGPAIACDTPRVASWWIDPTPDLDVRRTTVVRVLAGSHACEPADGLFANAWRVGSASNRQGLRLEGPALAIAAGNGDDGHAVSEPVAPGTVQLPADGQPIVLLADAQSHGGYPRIAHAISSDLPRLAQLRPGDTLRFASCTQARALQLRREQGARLQRIALAIQGRRWGTRR